MEDNKSGIHELLDQLESKQKKGRRNANLFFGLALAAAVALTFYSAWQSVNLARASHDLAQVQDQLRAANVSLDETNIEIAQAENELAAKQEVLTGLRRAITANKYQTKVPSLIGRTQEQAQGILLNLGLKMGKVTTVPSNETPGTILKQAPAAGSVGLGNAIDIVVAKGARAVVVPNLIGINIREAPRVLKASGLELGKADRKFTRALVTTIIAQKPSAGTIVPPGTRVDVIASGGR